MRITYIITSTDVEKLKQTARKLKKSEGIPLHEALDRVAQTAGLNHWHHVIESAKNFEPTETAYRSGVIIAMDGNDAGDFYDDTGIFVVDNRAEMLCEKDLYIDLCESPYEDNDGRFTNDRMRDKYTEEELKEIANDCLLDYVFFRYTGKSIPDNVGSVIEIVRKCSFWPPMYIWHKGKFEPSPSDEALDDDGTIVGLRL